MIYLLRYFLIVVYTIIWGTIACVGILFGGGTPLTCWVARNWIGWIVASCGIRIEAEGLQNFDPAAPLVLMTNHQSVFDIAAIVLTLPTDFHFVAKKELARVPFFGWALAGSGVGIMVDRRNRERSVKSLRQAAQRIREGANVIVFPEGTRSPTGELQAFKSGGFHLALQAGVPIVPATVSGSLRITPRGSLRVEPGTIKIVYGKPIPTEGLEVDDRDALKDRVRQAIEAGFDRQMQGPAPAQASHLLEQPTRRES